MQKSLKQEYRKRFYILYIQFSQYIVSNTRFKPSRFFYLGESFE